MAIVSGGIPGIPGVVLFFKNGKVWSIIYDKQMSNIGRGMKATWEFFILTPHTFILYI